MLNFEVAWARHAQCMTDPYKKVKVKISFFQQEHCMYITIIDRNNICHEYSVNAENG